METHPMPHGCHLLLGVVFAFRPGIRLWLNYVVLWQLSDWTLGVAGVCGFHLQESCMFLFLLVFLAWKGGFAFSRGSSAMMPGMETYAEVGSTSGHS